MSKENDIEQVKHTTRVSLERDKKELETAYDLKQRMASVLNGVINSDIVTNKEAVFLSLVMVKEIKSLKEVIEFSEQFLEFAESQDTDCVYDEYYNYIRYMVGDYKSVSMNTVVNFEDDEEEQ